MKTKMIRLITILSSFLILLSITYNAYAEYYFVSSSPVPVGCGVSCCNPCPIPPCVICITARAPYVHNVVGTSEEQDYEWVGDP
jgi:hypothetical protein